MGTGLEDFWSDVLSEAPERVLNRLAGLDEAERQPVLSHLRRMAGEAGWSEGQRRRASFALAEWERHDIDAPGAPQRQSD